MTYRHVLALEALVPELRRFGFCATTQNAPALLAFYDGYLPLIRPQSRGSYLRTLLSRLKAAASDLSERCDDAIAKSDLGDGLPDRSQRLLRDPECGAELERQTRELESHYGAALITQPWPGAERGNALLFYLQAHPSLVATKDVLHVAPESEVATWLRSVSNVVTLDGSTETGADLTADLTDLPLADASFDVVLCHRVLEHILDDLAAMRELYRVLRPGGVLNMSVPQAIHQERTVEWMIPDESHHLHVRQYGRDLTSRLESVGFTVRPVTWISEQPREELIRRGAYPMRMYEGAKA